MELPRPNLIDLRPVTHSASSAAGHIGVTPPNEVRVYTVDIDELIAIAKADLNRDMTKAQCEQYLHVRRLSQRSNSGWVGDR
jgi:hypothetical protein